MIKVLKLILVICLALGVTACQTDESPKPSHLRLLSMIPNTKGTLTIQGKAKMSEVHKTISLEYAQVTDYLELSQGHYRFTFSVRDKKLLEGTFVMGKNGYYTLLASGLLPRQWSVNPQSTVYKLKYMLAGSEVEDPNQYLPQWFMLRDNYDGSESHAYIRILNASPHVPTLQVKNDEKVLKKDLAYPKESDMIKIAASQHQLTVFYGDIQLAQKAFKAKPGYIYSVIIGDRSTSEKQCVVRVLENPSRTLMKSK